MNGPSLAETTYAKSLRDAFKQGRPWMSEPRLKVGRAADPVK